MLRVGLRLLLVLLTLFVLLITAAVVTGQVLLPASPILTVSAGANGAKDFYQLDVTRPLAVRFARREESIYGAVDWSADGEQLAYSCQVEFRYATCLLDRFGSGYRVAAISENGDTTAFWSQPDALIVFYRLTGRAFLQPLDEATTEAEYLFEYNTYDTALSPDGSQIAYIQASGQANTRALLRVFDIPTRQMRDLVVSDEFLSSPTWSPDGERIAFSTQTTVKQVGANGGSPKTLIDAPYWVRGISLTGARMLYLTSRENPNGGGGLYAIYALDQDEPLIELPGVNSEFTVDPSGRYLVVTVQQGRDTQNFWIIDTTSGIITELSINGIIYSWDWMP